MTYASHRPGCPDPSQFRFAATIAPTHCSPTQGPTRVSVPACALQCQVRPARRAVNKPFFPSVAGARPSAAAEGTNHRVGGENITLCTRRASSLPSAPSMASEIDRIVDAVVARVQQELGKPGASPKTSVTPPAGTGASPTPGIAAPRPRPDLARIIDHTLLKPDATRDDLRRLCSEAIAYHFYSVCVNSVNVPFVREQLRGSTVAVCAVVGFPLGAMSPSAKAFETSEAVRQGADEIDMVINVGALKSRDYALVLDDIARVVGAAQGRVVKVILETGMLTRDEKVIACALSKAAGAAFVKTSTGFGPGGATVEDVALMRAIVGPEMGVKASGGIRTAQDADRMVSAGANRIGASASVAIVTGGAGKTGY